MKRVREVKTQKEQETLKNVEEDKRLLSYRQHFVFGVVVRGQQTT